MNRSQMFALVAIVGLSVGLFLYVKKQEQLLYQMDYEFKNIKVTGLGSEALNFSFDLSLNNMSDLDVKIYNIDFRVKWNNMVIGKVNSVQKYIIPKRSEKTIPLTLTLSRNELNDALKEAFSSLQNFVTGVIKIEGTMDVGADFITISNFPFDYQDTASNLVGYSISQIIR